MDQNSGFNGDGFGPEIKPGTVIASRYEVVTCLGYGAMGTVYKCKHKDLADRLVALKILKEDIVKDKVAVERFRNEVIAAYDVSHKHVVRAYDFIQDGNIVAYTMEYINGGDLADKIDLGGGLPFKDVVRYLFEICLGAQALHEHGIIHRDLKPENILITENDEVKISDFGISIVDHQSRLTETGGIVGSANYLSPEYLTESIIDCRSDIYAIGVIAYEMLTGENPFPGDNLYKRLQNRVRIDAPHPQNMRPDCPDRLASIVLKALVRDPDKRFQSCNEILATLSTLDDYSEQIPTIAINMNNISKENLGKSLDNEFRNNSSGIDLDEFDQEEIDTEMSGMEFAQSSEPQFDVSLKQARQPTIMGRIDSETVDLTDSSLQSKKKLGVDLSFLTPKSEKVRSRLKKIVLFGVVGLLLLVLWMTAENMRRSEFEAIEKEREIVKNMRELKDAQNLLAKELEDPRIPLNREVIISKKVGKMKVKPKLVFKEGRVHSIDLEIIPPLNFETKDVPQIEKIDVKHLSISQSNEFFFTSIAHAEASILHNEKIHIAQTTAKITGKIHQDTGLITLEFVAPERLNVYKANNNYFVKKLKDKYIFYTYGNLAIRPEEISKKE